MENKSFTISSNYKNVNSACFITKTFCEDSKVKDTTIKEIELCMAEALNNIIKHSYKGDNSNLIDIALKIEDEKFSIALADYGFPRENLDKPTLEFDPNDIDSLPEGGMGLFIIEQLMDENSYTTAEGKNTFTLYKNVA
ncbi:MAG: ATP-binding protein [Ignavibacteriae bacterium]|nr:ATP-binding protein [Ignavibacteriota bacterium]